MHSSIVESDVGREWHSRAEPEVPVTASAAVSPLLGFLGLLARRSLSSPETRQFSVAVLFYPNLRVLRTSPLNGFPLIVAFMEFGEL